jgi:hypothetical protein
MRIIGFNLTKILAEKKDEINTNLKVNQNIDIKDICEEKIPITDNKVLKFTFKLSLGYSDDYAKIELEGNILAIPEKDELNKYLNAWKNKKIPAEARIPLFNFIMNKCNIKALNLEDEMGLPLHIPMPRITTDNKKLEKPKNENQ